MIPISAPLTAVSVPHLIDVLKIMNQDKHTYLACPLCEGEMLPGVIAGRSPGVKFKAEKDILGDLTGKKITEGVFNHSAKALRCSSCFAVLVLPLK